MDDERTAERVLLGEGPPGTDPRSVITDEEGSPLTAGPEHTPEAEPVGSDDVTSMSESGVATEIAAASDATSGGEGPAEAPAGDGTSDEAPVVAGTTDAPADGSMRAETTGTPESGTTDAPEGGSLTVPEVPEDPEVAEVAEVPEVARGTGGAEVAEGVSRAEASDVSDVALASEASGQVQEPVVAGPPEIASHGSAPRVRRRVSEEIARHLHALGARFCFTVPGESFLPLIDDLTAVGIRVVTTRHESSAAFMADALARSLGRPQLVAVSRAPGAANASIGIHAAAQDSAPVIALVGQVERAYIGREAFQEVDLVRSFGSLTQLAAQLEDPADTPALLARVAKRLHAGRPGPVLLSLPQDILDLEVESDDTLPQPVSGARGPGVDRLEIRRVMKLLAASERGVIVAGGGVLRARATKRLVALSEALAVPVIAAWRRPDVFPNDHPNYLGMAGPWGASTVLPRLADADVVVFIGARVSDTTTFDYAIPSPTAQWAHVDLQTHVGHGGLGAPTVAVEADASRFLDAAWSDLRAAALDGEMRSRREARMRADREAWRAATDVGRGAWDGPGVHPGRLVRTLRAILPDNATIATDAGNMGGWLVRGYRFRRPGTLLGTASGAMGFGLPAAIAASLADPDRIAVAFCGDGGLAMTMAELETAVREGAHPVVIVLDDRRYTTIAMYQAREGRPQTSSELGPVDFAAVARAHGALGFSVERDADVEPALREAIASRQTSLLHISLDRAWVSVDENPVS